MDWKAFVDVHRIDQSSSCKRERMKKKKISRNWHYSKKNYLVSDIASWFLQIFYKLLIVLLFTLTLSMNNVSLFFSFFFSFCLSRANSCVLCGFDPQRVLFCVTHEEFWWFHVCPMAVFTVHYTYSGGKWLEFWKCYLTLYCYFIFAWSYIPLCTGKLRK